MVNLKNAAWNIKHRPTTVMDVVSTYNERICNYLKEPNTIPNFLFYSRIGGTGKSSMGLAIIKELGCDKLILNASSDRSIDVTRTKIKEFARSKSTNGMKRCVYCDEAEKFTKDAMDALKNLIEEFAENTFYIFTTNNINKIPQPMQSRFAAKYEFIKPDKGKILLYLKKICDIENLLYTDEGLNKIISLHYPSIRECVNMLQDLYIQKLEVKIENISKHDEEFSKLWGLIKAQKFNEIRTDIFTNGVDCLLFNRWLFYNIMDEGLDLKKQIKLTQIFSRTEKDISFGADANIVFIASVPEIIMAVK